MEQVLHQGPGGMGGHVEPFPACAATWSMPQCRICSEIPRTPAPARIWDRKSSSGLPGVGWVVVSETDTAPEICSQLNWPTVTHS